MEDDKILDLADELLQSREWTDTNWQGQSIEVASAMYRAATQLRILLRSVQTLESQYGVQLNKCDAAIKERDEARREVCKGEAIIRLQRNHSHRDSEEVVLKAKEISVERGWDCFKET